MAVRPNIQSLVLEGKDLIVKGETDHQHLPTAIFVVVTQDGVAGAAPASASGIVDRVGSGWTATLRETAFQKGAPAKAIGVQIHADQVQVTSWVQSRPIN